jgi:hypothetical protein
MVSLKDLSEGIDSPLMILTEFIRPSVKMKGWWILAML